MTDALFDSDIPELELLSRGKVRDIYAVDDEALLIVTTDRLSAFDVILDDPIPGKGAVLTAVSNFWFRRFGDILPNHLLDRPLEDIITDAAVRERVASRSIVVRRLNPLPVEAIVRGYLVGSGWKDYQKTGAVCGIALAEGLDQAARLDDPIYTPSTKAEVGDHDENVDFEHTVQLMGRERAEAVRDAALALYSAAREYAAERGIIIADTKFEFGTDTDGQLYLIDEALTPDSSRFWPADEYQVGANPPSFDKQYVRDWLEAQDWDKTAPGPRLPADVIETTAAKYREAQRRITGE